MLKSELSVVILLLVWTMISLLVGWQECIQHLNHLTGGMLVMVI